MVSMEIAFKKWRQWGSGAVKKEEVQGGGIEWGEGRRRKEPDVIKKEENR